MSLRNFKSYLFLLLLFMLILALLNISTYAIESPINSIHVKDGKICTPDGAELIMKGVNTIDVYYLRPPGDPEADEHLKALERAKAHGVNAVRITWNIVDDPYYKELTKAAKLKELERTIDKCRELELYVILTLHYDAFAKKNNMTFFSTFQLKTLREHIYYWIRDAREIAKANKDILIVNMINEYSSNDTSNEDWIASHRDAIVSLRAAGIDNCLMVDAPRWGIEVNRLLKYGSQVLNCDPLKNVAFDIHAYYYDAHSGYLANQTLLNNFIDRLEAKKFPFIFGEFARQNGAEDKPMDIAMFLNVCNKRRISYFAYSLYSKSKDPLQLDHAMSNDFAKTFKDWGLLKAMTGKTYFDYVREGLPQRNLFGEDSGDLTETSPIGIKSILLGGALDQITNNSLENENPVAGMFDSSENEEVGFYQKIKNAFSNAYDKVVGFFTGD